MTDRPAKHYFPVVICAIHDSPIDALIGMHVPLDEVMNLVTASWMEGGAQCVLASVDGGRNVAAVLLPNGHWAAGNAFVEDACSTWGDAERKLRKLLKRNRLGTVGVVTQQGVAETKKPAQS